MYMFTFYILVGLIFLNLFIAIILQGYASTNQRNQKIFNSDIKEMFIEAWSKYD